MVNTPQINGYYTQYHYYNRPNAINNWPAYQVNGGQNGYVYNQSTPIQYNQIQSTIQANQPQALQPSQDKFKVPTLDRQTARELKIKGNNFRLKGDLHQAIEYYKKSLELYPEYTNALYNLGRTYRDVGELGLAIDTFNKLLSIDPKDLESRTLLGEFYTEAGSIDNALSAYKGVLAIEPNYDFARRNMQALIIKKIALTDPQAAEKESQRLAQKTLKDALLLIQQYAPPNIVANLQGITIAFGMTEEVNKYENLAQYENANKRILISNKLAYASPNVVATYLVHEAVHAGDKDSITSIKEEQDAFREMTKFWIATHNNIIDPDLTLAKNLYEQGPEVLDNKVASLYTKRDADIRKTSPGHGEPIKQQSIIDNLYDKFRSMLPVNSLNSDPGYYVDPYGNYYYTQPVPAYYPPAIPIATPNNPFVANNPYIYAPGYSVQANNPFFNQGLYPNVAQTISPQSDNQYRYITLSNSDR